MIKSTFDNWILVFNLIFCAISCLLGAIGFFGDFEKTTYLMIFLGHYILVNFSYYLMTYFFVYFQ